MKESLPAPSKNELAVNMPAPSAGNSWEKPSTDTATHGPIFLGNQESALVAEQALPVVGAEESISQPNDNVSDDLNVNNPDVASGAKSEKEDKWVVKEREAMRVAQAGVWTEKSNADAARWNTRVKVYAARDEVVKKIEADPNYTPSTKEIEALQNGDHQEQLDERAGKDAITEDDINYYNRLKKQAAEQKLEDIRKGEAGEGDDGEKKTGPGGDDGTGPTKKPGPGEGDGDDGEKKLGKGEDEAKKPTEVTPEETAVKGIGKVAKRIRDKRDARKAERGLKKAEDDGIERAETPVDVKTFINEDGARLEQDRNASEYEYGKDTETMKDQIQDLLENGAENPEDITRANIIMKKLYRGLVKDGTMTRKDARQQKKDLFNKIRSEYVDKGVKEATQEISDKLVRDPIQEQTALEAELQGFKENGAYNRDARKQLKRVLRKLGKNYITHGNFNRKDAKKWRREQAQEVGSLANERQLVAVTSNPIEVNLDDNSGDGWGSPSRGSLAGSKLDKDTQGQQQEEVKTASDASNKGREPKKANIGPGKVVRTPKREWERLKASFKQ